jgi:dihydroflavonol-4-reductase
MPDPSSNSNDHQERAPSGAPIHTEKPVILVTGSEGLIGDAIVQRLADRYEIASFDIARPHKRPELQDFIDCDFTKDSSVAQALATLKERHGDKLASVIHLAAYYNFSGEPSPLYKELTVDGTQRLLRGLKKDFEVEQFVFSSTHILLKPSENGELLDENSPVEGAWAYPASKIQAERLIEAEHDSIPAVILRVAGVYNEEGHTVPIAQQFARIYEKSFESYFFPGDPSNGQAFVHLDDLVDLIALVIQHRHQLGPYEVFNAAEPEVMSYDELQDTIGELVHGVEWPTLRIPATLAKVGAWAMEKMPGDGGFIKPWMIDLADDHYPLDVSKAQELLGWNPSKRLRTTLPAMAEFLKRDPKGFYKMNGLESEEHTSEPDEKVKQPAEETVRS